MSTTSKELYDSVRLPLGTSNNIRLLEIVDADEEQPIECKLHLASLGDPHVQYIALSYMWGPGAASEMITINGTEIKIRRNLQSFLRQRRIDRRGIPVDESKFLWIDALCINQGSSSERNHQVAMMGQIYAKACKVLIWLGVAMDNIMLESGRAIAEYQQYERPPSLGPGCLVFDVLMHPYWSRAWILQECVLARQLDLQVDQIMIPSLELSLITSFLESIVSFLPSTDAEFVTKQYLSDCNRQHMMGLLGAISVLRLRRDWQLNNVGILPWTFGPSKLRCSDPREKIYSLLAIMDSSIVIEPDYDKSREQLFLDIVVRCQNRLEKFNVRNLSLLLEVRSMSNDEVRPLRDQELLLGTKSLGFIKDGKFIGDESALSDAMLECLHVLGFEERGNAQENHHIRRRFCGRCSEGLSTETSF